MARRESDRQAGPDRLIPPWSRGDVELAAQGYDWPRVEVGGRIITGEAEWTAALDAADDDELETLHAALPDEADPDDDQDDVDDDEPEDE